MAIGGPLSSASLRAAGAGTGFGDVARLTGSLAALQTLGVRVVLDVVGTLTCIAVAILVRVGGGCVGRGQVGVRITVLARGVRYRVDLAAAGHRVVRHIGRGVLEHGVDGLAQIALLFNDRLDLQIDSLKSGCLLCGVGVAVD
ncbi:hypothetical protein PG995_011395 [Apiospora arundinis]|uniref:Uncharacterized protein n=1 Tax=Apiospora arundinis TaxID=335852 RepID=A0ABR2IUJ7_9PEZI